MGSAAAAGLFAGGSAWAASAGANVAVVPAAAAPPTTAVFRKSRRPNPSPFMTISPGSYRLLLARSMLSLIGTSKAGFGPRLRQPLMAGDPSFRDGPKDQARNLEIPGSSFARPGMTRRPDCFHRFAPREDATKRILATHHVR